MADTHREEGQAERARDIEEALERLQSGETSGEKSSSVRERLDRAAAEFKREHERQASSLGKESKLIN